MMSTSGARLSRNAVLKKTRDCHRIAEPLQRLHVAGAAGLMGDRTRARAGARPGLRLALGPLRRGCGAGGPRGLGGSPRRGSASAGHDEAAGHPALRASPRSEEHTSELQSRENLVCRLLLEKKKHMP